MKIEQAILENLRKLPIDKQQEVLNFTETLTKTHSLPSPYSNLTPQNIII